MGVRRLGRQRGRRDGRAARCWAVPVIVVTAPGLGASCCALFPVTPVSPLPPTGEPTGFVAVSSLAGVDRRAVRRGDPVPRRSRRRPGSAASACGAGVVRAALVFALAHVLTDRPATTRARRSGSPSSASATRIPVALALGWLFLRRGIDLGVVRAARGVQRDPARPRRGREPVGRQRVSRGEAAVEPPVRGRR